MAGAEVMSGTRFGWRWVLAYKHWFSSGQVHLLPCVSRWDHGWEGNPCRGVRVRFLWWTMQATKWCGGVSDAR